MLKELFDAFRGEGAVTELMKKFDEMLSRCGENYKRIDPEAVRSANMGSVREEVRRNDKAINELEKAIRYQILGHLTVNPSSDTSTCMVLMVVSKDAERIGDYIKNILEVLESCGPERYGAIHIADLKFFREMIGNMLPAAQKAFSGSDVVLAQQVIMNASTLAKKVDHMVQVALESDPPALPDPLPSVLLARYYKRISAHLSNICTAVTSPVDMLGYHDEPR